MFVWRVRFTPPHAREPSATIRGDASDNRPHRGRPPELSSLGARDSRGRWLRRRRRGRGRPGRDRRGAGPRARRPPARHPASRHERLRHLPAARRLEQREARSHPCLEPRARGLRRPGRDVLRARLPPQGRAVRGGGSGHPRLSRLTLALGLALLVVETAVAVALIATSDHDTSKWTNAALALTAGIAFVVSGLVALVRRPENRTGTYMAAVGYVWFLGALTESNNQWVFVIGILLGSLVWGPVAALALVYPTGRFASRLESTIPWIVVAAGSAVMLAVVL